MRIDYVTALTGFPLGVTLALFVYALVYMRMKEQYTMNSEEVRRSAINVIGVMCVISAGLTYWLRREPCRSSLFGGLTTGALLYMTTLVWGRK